MKKLLFIMNDSEAFLRDEVIRTYEKWGFKSSNVKNVETWNPALSRGSLSLFGESSMVHLDLTDKKYLKEFADLISGKTTKQLFEDDWFSPGLIITTIHAQGAKKIESLITKSGGEIIKKAKPEEMKKLLLDRVSLNTETHKFVSTYAGDNYQMLIGIVNQLEKMNKEEQSSLTIDEMITKLPTNPGSVPPWEFINPMLEGNAESAIDLYTRGIENSHILVTMQLARTKLQLLYRLKLLSMANVWNSKEQAAILGERNGPNIWITANVAKKVSIQTAEYLAKLALTTEANLKGHSNADPNLIFVNFIAAVTIAINQNRALPLKIR